MTNKELALGLQHRIDQMPTAQGYILVPRDWLQQAVDGLLAAFTPAEPPQQEKECGDSWTEVGEQSRYCIRPLGHSGPHTDNGDLMWKDTPPEFAVAPAEPQTPEPHIDLSLYAAPVFSSQTPEPEKYSVCRICGRGASNKSSHLIIAEHGVHTDANGKPNQPNKGTAYCDRCEDETLVVQAVAHIELTPAEIQSGLDRVRWAEGLIRQLPESHEGRNSWLLNYAAPVSSLDALGLRPMTWETAARILGENLASCGPHGYGDFTPEQWLEWAKSMIPESSSARPDRQTVETARRVLVESIAHITNLSLENVEAELWDDFDALIAAAYRQSKERPK